MIVKAREKRTENEKGTKEGKINKRGIRRIGKKETTRKKKEKRKTKYKRNFNLLFLARKISVDKVVGPPPINVI